LSFIEEDEEEPEKLCMLGETSRGEIAGLSKKHKKVISINVFTEKFI